MRIRAVGVGLAENSERLLKNGMVRVTGKDLAKVGEIRQIRVQTGCTELIAAVRIVTQKQQDLVCKKFICRGRGLDVVRAGHRSLSESDGAVLGPLQQRHRV